MGWGRAGWDEAGQGGQGRMGWGTTGQGGTRAGQDERARKLKSSGRRRGERNIRPTLDCHWMNMDVVGTGCPRKEKNVGMGV